MKYNLEDRAQRRLIDAAEEDIVAVIKREGPQSFEQLDVALNYPNYDIAGSLLRRGRCGNRGNRQGVRGVWQYLQRNAHAVSFVADAFLRWQLVAIRIEESN